MHSYCQWIIYFFIEFVINYNLRRTFKNKIFAPSAVVHKSILCISTKWHFVINSRTKTTKRNKIVSISIQYVVSCVCTKKKSIECVVRAIRYGRWSWSKFCNACAHSYIASYTHRINSSRYYTRPHFLMPNQLKIEEKQWKREINGYLAAQSRFILQQARVRNTFLCVCVNRMRINANVISSSILRATRVAKVGIDRVAAAIETVLFLLFSIHNQTDAIIKSITFYKLWIPRLLYSVLAASAHKYSRPFSFHFSQLNASYGWVDWLLAILEKAKNVRAQSSNNIINVMHFTNIGHLYIVCVYYIIQINATNQPAHNETNTETIKLNGKRLIHTSDQRPQHDCVLLRRRTAYALSLKRNM